MYFTLKLVCERTSHCQTLWFPLDTRSTPAGLKAATYLSCLPTLAPRSVDLIASTSVLELGSASPSILLFATAHNGLLFCLEVLESMRKTPARPSFYSPSCTLLQVGYNYTISFSILIIL
jgi:hypothetical protein